jgi:hypothetical protein
MTMRAMTPSLFALIPSGVTLLYVTAQFIAHAMTGRMYFSSTFVLELLAYCSLGLLYLVAAFHIGKKRYLRLSIIGFILGAALFIIGGVTLFLNFEFGRDLSI